MATKRSGGSSRQLMNPKTDAQRNRAYRAESALSTLTAAEQIKRDPGLMRDAKSLAKAKAAEMNKISGAGRK